MIASTRKKGWLPAYRDAVMFKVAYSYGVRFNELRHLQTVDFSRNPHAPEFGLDDGIDLFPSERGALVAERTLPRRFRRYCNDLELSAGLDLHSFRRSYITHLIEDGWDAKFVQDQAGHEYASTTGW